MKIIDSKCWSSARRFAVPAETAQPEERSFTVSGSSTGPGIFELFLGEGASPSTFEFLQTIDPDVDYGDGTWSIPLTLEAGQYTLEARGTHLHPDSNYQATDSSTFTVAAPDPANITTTYDAHGRVETRSWASGDVVQTFGWDGQGHLLSITQIDTGTTETVGSYIWTAQYDGFGRRFQTDYAPDGAHAITIEKNRIKTWFDPQVEYMVAAVEHHGKREWMVHDTGYGSFQGLGGLEAIVDEATGQTTPIVDTVHGHVVATIDLGDTSIIADDLVIYKEQQFGGYGPLPSSEQQPLEVTESLAESLGWQTRCVDPTSFFAMGARHYDSLSGRFLSADPLGHGATPDLYSYAGGNPINFVDPTGRMGQDFGLLNDDPNFVRPEVDSFGDFFDIMLTDLPYAAYRGVTGIPSQVAQRGHEIRAEAFDGVESGNLVTGPSTYLAGAAFEMGGFAYDLLLNAPENVADLAAHGFNMSGRNGDVNASNAQLVNTMARTEAEFFFGEVVPYYASNPGQTFYSMVSGDPMPVSAYLDVSGGNFNLSLSGNGSSQFLTDTATTATFGLANTGYSVSSRLSGSTPSPYSTAYSVLSGLNLGANLVNMNYGLLNDLAASGIQLNLTDQGISANYQQNFGNTQIQANANVILDPVQGNNPTKPKP